MLHWPWYLFALILRQADVSSRVRLIFRVTPLDLLDVDLFLVPLVLLRVNVSFQVVLLTASYVRRIAVQHFLAPLFSLCARIRKFLKDLLEPLLH
jgi:hypothetical protein